MMMLLIVGGGGLALLGYQFTEWMRQIPDRNEDFDAMSPTAFVERGNRVPMP